MTTSRAAVGPHEEEELTPDPVALHDMVEGHLEDLHNPVVQSVFGTSDVGVIVAMIGDAVRTVTGCGIAGGVFCTASSGYVVGVHLSDGRTVVVKSYQPRWEEPFLRAVQCVQQTIHAHGTPCPEPLGGPTPIALGWATIESYLPDPGHTGPTDPRMLGVSSAGLVDLVVAARGVPVDGLDRHPFRIAPGELYPAPHNPIFDFGATAQGAEWIDELAAAAWERRGTGGLPEVVGHLDWSANNVRLNGSGVTAVYDCDSLSLAPEAVIAGQAAATWRSTGETWDLEAPDAAEIDLFIHSFAHARARPFSSSEIEVAHAAALWVMAYTARCEHALEARTTWVRTRGRDWLRSQARSML